MRIELTFQYRHDADGLRRSHVEQDRVLRHALSAVVEAIGPATLSMGTHNRQAGEWPGEAVATIRMDTDVVPDPLDTAAWIVSRIVGQPVDVGIYLPLVPVRTVYGQKQASPMQRVA